MTHEVPQHIKNRVDAKILDCLAIAESTHGRVFNFPSVVYKTQGTTAGWAHSSDCACNQCKSGTREQYSIDLNPILLMENVNEFIEDTVVHELAHVITWELHPKSKPHGKEWQDTMILFGAAPDRLHNFDVTTIKENRTPRKRKAKHLWRCGCGGAEIVVTDKKHDDMIAKFVTKTGNRFQYVLGHKRCGYSYVGEVELSSGESRVREYHKARKVSKLDQAKKLFDIYGYEKTRKEMIEILTINLKMKSTTASTYYNKLKNEGFSFEGS